MSVSPTLEVLIQRVEARGWNWDVSRHGQNPDGTWQYWAHIWAPFGFRPDVTVLGASAAGALVAAFNQSETLMGAS